MTILANPRIRGERPKLPYAGYSGFVVRTVLVRPKDYDPRAAPRIRSALDVAVLTAHLGDEDQEYAVAVFTNQQRRLVAIHETGIGSATSVKRSTPHTVKAALLSNASYVWIVHNHPGGSVKPSKKDVQNARKVRDALECVGVALEDSVIVSLGRYVSLRKLGQLKG